MRAFGVGPDLGLIAAVAVAWYEGPEVGALVGFCAGVFVDFFVSTPVGLTALAWGLVAYLVGSARVVLDRRIPMQTMLLAFAAGLLGGVLFALFAVLVGAEALQHAHTVSVILGSSLYDAVLAPLVFLLVRTVGRAPARLR